MDAVMISDLLCCDRVDDRKQVTWTKTIDYVHNDLKIYQGI